MEGKKIKMDGGCVIRYEAKPAENGDVNAMLSLEGKGIDILVGIRSIIDGICTENNIPVSAYLKWIEGLAVESTSVDVGAIERAMEGKK